MEVMDYLSSEHLAALSGAEYLASIFGTEKDKVNCSFYFKIGACRHGKKCSRIHNKPSFSQVELNDDEHWPWDLGRDNCVFAAANTVLLKNLYRNPKLNPANSQKEVSEVEEQRHFDDFFEEIFVEAERKYGVIEEMNVCDNIGEHMVGNVYIKFRREKDAAKAEADLNNRWFGGEAIYAELSPVTDFREACCRQYEMGFMRKNGLLKCS